MAPKSLEKTAALTSAEKRFNVLVLPQSRIVQIVSQGIYGILEGKENNHQQLHTDNMGSQEMKWRDDKIF